MSIPQPAKDIDGHCSAIVDNTLYVLSSNSFQSLPLKQHAQWSKEALGVPVTGPACVLVGEDSDAYLYVIGGETDDSSFSGLQIYSFKTKSWQTISTQAPVLQGRTNHSAAYLQDSQSIITYAGSQPNAPSYLSSQTFLISTVEPYTINSYITYAPTANLPILQPFNTSHAVMVGGSELNTQVWTFEPTMGFQPMDLYLLSPLPSTARGIVLSGSDGSKVLEVYDTSVSPNNVSQIVLEGAYGQPAYTGQTVGTPPSRKRKRDLSLANWPAYNDTNAPTTTRTDSSIAQGFRVSVISGGDQKDPVSIFNNNDNSWIDAGNFFDSKQVKQQPLKPTTSAKSTSTTSTSTATASATTTAAAAPSDNSAHDQMVRTLGITLGVLCGIAAIFIIVLLLLRRRKMKKRKAEGYLDEKENNNNRMSFADRGASFMKEAGGSVNGLPPPGKSWNNSKNGSQSSLAIVTGRFGKRNTNGHQPNASYDSTTRLVKGRDGTVIGGEPVEMVDLDEKKRAEQRRPSLIARTEPKVPPAHYGPNLTAEDANDTERRKRSSGWSKYFATSQPTGPNGLSHLPSAYGKGTNTYSDASMYSNDRGVSQPSQIPSSALIPPLDLDFTKSVDGQRLSHVQSRSPAFNDSREDLASRGSRAQEGQTGLIVDPNRPRSQSTTISSFNRSTMSSTMTTSEYYDNTSATPWTPTSNSFKDHLNSRPPSSVYDTRDRVPSRGKSSFYPGAGTSSQPRSKGSKLSHTGAPTSEWASPTLGTAGLKGPQRPADDRDSTVTVFPTGVPSQQYPGKGIAMPAITRPWASDKPEDRDSTLTQFPGVASTYYPGRDRVQEQAKPVNSDLGWLNLNESQTRL